MGGGGLRARAPPFPLLRFARPSANGTESRGEKGACLLLRRCGAWGTLTARRGCAAGAPRAREGELALGHTVGEIYTGTLHRGWQCFTFSPRP